MSNLREKAREIKKAGEDARGDFEPEGAPLRMYQYWLDRSNTKRARDVKAGTVKENFCHYWRVVFLWAPLMFANRSVTKVVTHPATIISAIILAVVVFGYVMATSEAVLGTVLVALALVAGIAYLVAGLTAGGCGGQDRGLREDALWKGVMGLTAPISLPVFGVSYAFKEHEDISVKVLLGTLITIAVGLTGLVLFEGTMAFGWMLWAGIVGGIVAIGGAILGFNALSTFISGKRALAEKRRDEARAKALEAFYAGEGPNPYAPKKETNEVPEWMDKAFDAIIGVFSAIGDFIVLISQVARVNKWKICPTVTVPVETKEEAYEPHPYW